MDLMQVLAQILNPQGAQPMNRLTHSPRAEEANYLTQPSAGMAMPQMPPQAAPQGASMPAPSPVPQQAPQRASNGGTAANLGYEGPITKAGGYPEGTLIPSRNSRQPPVYTGGGRNTGQESGGGFLQTLFDPEAKARSTTFNWLVNEKGYDESAASVIVRDKTFLQQVLRDHARGGDPKTALEMEKLRLEVDEKRNPRPSFSDQIAAARLEFDRSNADMTTDIREYQQAKKEGYQGELRDWILETSRAGAASITNDITGEKGYDKTVGEGYGKRFLDIQTEAQTAQRALNSFDVMDQMMADPGFYSGSGGETVAALKRFGSALGMDPNGISSIETFNAMSKQAALDTMGGSLGTGFSNADRSFVVEQVPHLGNTPEGNRTLIGIQRKLAKRKQEIAGLSREYAQQNGGRIDAGFDDYLAKWAEQNPLFPQQPQGSGASRGAGTDTGRQRARNPKTGEVLEWDGTRWSPAR
ncbi:hypothetical protein [Mesorhizobium sp. WSM2239]|uniref:Uncharacterized protein n=2 Tax=unclassified Mesorhizobium TaxID=325217 RepID=A0AAU8DCW7_9HYPH